MSKSIPEHALVVVADGQKAKLFRRTGSGDALTLHAEKDLTSAGFVAETPSGSQPGDQSPKQTEEAGFASHLAQALYQMHQHGQFKDLVLVVDPQTLGQVRKAMHKTVEAAVVKTVSKDLTNHPMKAIEAALTD